MRRTLLVVLVACHAAAPPPPTPPSTVDQLLAVITTAGDRACACADRACTEAVEADLAPAIAASTVPPRWIDDEAARARVEPAEWRVIRCLQDHDTVAYAFAPLAAAYGKANADAECACQDWACFDATMRADRVPALHAGAVPIDDDTESAISADTSRLAACAAPLGDGAAAAITTAFEALRDRGCACTDHACAQAVFEDFVRSARQWHPPFSERQKAALVAPVRDLVTCLQPFGVAK